MRERKIRNSKVNFLKPMIVSAIIVSLLSLLPFLALAEVPQQKSAQTSNPPRHSSGERSAWGFRLFPFLNYENRFERGVETNLESRTPTSFALGARWNRWHGLLENSRYSVKTGNAMLSVDRQHQEFLLWVRYDAYRSKAGNLYLAAAPGVFQESVQTQLNGSVAKDESDWKMSTGLAIGAELWWKFLLVGGEARMTSGEDYDPNPMMGYIFRIGFEI